VTGVARPRLFADETEFTAVLAEANVHPEAFVVDGKGTLCSRTTTGSTGDPATGSGNDSSGSNDSSDDRAGTSDSHSKSGRDSKTGSGSARTGQANGSHANANTNTNTNTDTNTNTGTNGSTSGSRRLAPMMGSPGSEFVVKGSLSVGGMGEVLLAHQGTLGRDVAVKVPKASAPRQRDADLIVEGRVVGQLEHPNIVPVHALGHDEQGRPMLVMKRVEGQSWRELLKAGRDRDRDLRIAMEVCQALHFAHSRGVVHCDVKPANVMVGRFGEVYLVDWGIAVGFGDCSIDGVPHESGVTGVFGTPKYMAPELALPDSTIDPRTDVYVMGAVLFEVVTGRPLRAGRRTAELVHQAHLAAPPVFGAGAGVGVDADVDVDDELRGIIGRCLAREPAERFDSAEALRLALVTYLAHGAVRVILDRAQQALTRLEQAIAADAVDDAAVRQLGNECRFGFRTALSAWPESKRATEGLVAVLERLLRFELARGELAASRGLLRELEAVHGGTRPLLQSEVQQLADSLSAQQAEVSSLQRFAIEHDRGIAERERAVAVFFAAFAWLITTAILDRLAAAAIFTAGPGVFAVFTGLFAVVFAGAGFFMPRLRQTEASRAMIITMALTEAGLAGVYAIGEVLGMTAAPMLAIGQTMLTVTGGTFAASDKRLWPAVVLSALSVPPLLVWPDRAIAINGVACFFVLLHIAWRWRTDTPAPTTPAPTTR